MPETMPNLPEVVSREEWRESREALLEKEKELTRLRDELNAERRRLPMVEIAKDYRFRGPDGEATLLDLFEGRRQLIVYHFMWLWDEGRPRDEGCPSCSAGADEVSDGLLEHLHARGTTLAFVSRAPWPEIDAYRAKRGWTFPFYSSHGSDFNYDFHVSFDEAVAPVEYNYRSATELEEAGLPVGAWEQPFDLHGHSVFLRVGDRVFHTYSMYARGAETVGGSYYWLDLTALGRQEEWEEPEGRAADPGGPDPSFSA
ncbi:MAG: DUF899 domain-containing protein [Gemmatimonadota bacterium]